MVEPALVPIGYFPKEIAACHAAALGACGVKWVRSVSCCISPGPANWLTTYTYNDWWAYATIATAWTAVPTGERSAYEVLAYRVLPSKWDKGRRFAVAIPDLGVEKLPADFEAIGFDVVSMEWEEMRIAGFGHSPLSCNYMAQTIEVNEHCLLDSLERAVEAAMEFSTAQPEPGPYYVLEVLRRAGK
jgi:hypothetical protein